MGAPVIAHGDAAPVFDFGEHVFDLVAFFVERGVVPDALCAVFAWRNTWDDAGGRDGFPKPVGIIPSVSQQRVGVGHVGQQSGRTPVIADLACRQMKGHRFAVLIAHGVKLGI